MPPLYAANTMTAIRHAGIILPVFKFVAIVKEHATLSAGASVDHGVEAGTEEEHVNRAADRGCCVSSCSALRFLGCSGYSPAVTSSWRAEAAPRGPI